MEEKNVKLGFWGEYFKSLNNHPLRTIVVTAILVDAANVILSNTLNAICKRDSE